MAIGEYETVGSDNHARADARRLSFSLRFDSHDCGADTVDDAYDCLRIGVEQRAVLRGGGR